MPEALPEFSSAKPGSGSRADWRCRGSRRPQVRQASQNGRPIKNNGRAVNKAVLAPLDHDGFVGMWPFSGKVYDDNLATLRIDGGQENPQMVRFMPRLW